MTNPPSPIQILPSHRAWPLHGVQGSRQIERAALAALPAGAQGALMERAGLAVARLALALVPQGRRVWVLAGPGNNGGDGLVAARLLHRCGWQVQVVLLADAARLPADARAAYERARAAGVEIREGWPEAADADAEQADLLIDALFGLGASRAPQGAHAAAIGRINAARVPVLAIDLPSGIDGDTGRCIGDAVVRATHTLSLLTLKPGLLFARDAVGQLWLDVLGVPVDEAAHAPVAMLAGPPPTAARLHAQHKGSFGDVWVIGGAAGMAGAVTLASRAALAAGAGRVYLARLSGDAEAIDPLRPEIMPRSIEVLAASGMPQGATVVCGCGGGVAVTKLLPQLLHAAPRLVLDADALNAIAADPGLAQRLRARRAHGLHSLLTPHPLEAARLLGIATAEVQADRLQAAMQLAERMQCGVLLKGSGTVIAAPGRVPLINPTGNARLATAGSGDVLAGWIGGLWAQQPEPDGVDAAAAAAWCHGHAAECETDATVLRAADLIDAMASAKTLAKTLA